MNRAKGLSLWPWIVRFKRFLYFEREGLLKDFQEIIRGKETGEIEAFEGPTGKPIDYPTEFEL